MEALPEDPPSQLPLDVRPSKRSNSLRFIKNSGRIYHLLLPLPLVPLLPLPLALLPLAELATEPATKTFLKIAKNVH